MNGAAAALRYSLAGLIAALVVLACASEEGTVFDLRDGRPDASIDTGIPHSSGGAPSADPCRADFCPADGPGAPCCITSTGPCGMDTGEGCRAPACQPEMCPAVGPGAPCCATRDGPCGMDNGDGCRVGSCDPNFCPLTGPGAPCCTTPDGPCGMDNGLGCQIEVGPDF